MKTSKRDAMTIGRPVVDANGAAGEPQAGELGSTRGVVFVEYVALLLLVTITGAAAVASLGIPLVHLFRYQQLVLSLPIP